MQIEYINIKLNRNIVKCEFLLYEKNMKIYFTSQNCFTFYGRCGIFMTLDHKTSHKGQFF